MTFLCEMTTPAGERVDPDVYWRDAVLGRTHRVASSSRGESRSSESTATTIGTGPCAARACGAYFVTSSMTDEVVRMTAGKESRNRCGNSFVVNAKLRHRKRNSDETGLQHAQKGNDVFKPLRG